MTFHFKISLRSLYVIAAMLVLHANALLAQDCQPGYVLNPVTTTNTIEWDKFPEFSLPFQIIYSAPRFGDTDSKPLKHGFSHLAMFSGAEPGSLAPAQRANLWYGVATSSGNQPWADIALRSPWGNDTIAYRNYWDNYARTIYDASIICLDIERMQREDRDILALKNNTAIPANYRSLSDADFLLTYKRDMRWWYTEAVNRLKMQKPGVTVSSYSDVPVRNTWLNITTNSWQDWTTNLARTHYLTQNDAGQIGGIFYNALDILTPSPYYYYGYDHPIGKDYLSYLLFNIEANVAWSDKPVVPFVWMRIHDSYDPDTPLITDFQAEATAIFPFFSGAKGLWLWENPFFPGNRQENYAPYEHFIYGLYRLSEFSDMFTGEYQLVIPQSARDNMALQNPVWRGVVKGNDILIAAQNPYADDQAETPVLVSHQNWARSITLKGRQVFLCKFDLRDITNDIPSAFSDAFVYPTTAQHDLNVVLTGANGISNVTFSLLNTKGQVVIQQPLFTHQGETHTNIPLPNLASGMYFARFTSNSKTIVRKVVVHQ